MASLRRLLERNDTVYWPTHGPAITRPKPHVEAFIAHRLEREAEIRGCLGRGIAKIKDMVPIMYTGLPEFMYPAAARSVFAAMLHMVERGEVRCDGDVSLDAVYSLEG